MKDRLPTDLNNQPSSHPFNSSKSPYEIRLEVLKLATEILKYEDKTLRVASAPVERVLSIASNLNDFISNNTSSLKRK